MKLHIFGESHAPEIGVEIEGVPKGTVIDLDALQAFLDRRAPGNGQGGMSTPRKEPDKVEFDKGVVGGVATGETIRAVIRNTNTRPQDYANVATVPRPGHADYASWLKCRLRPVGPVRPHPDGRRQVVGTDDGALVHCRRHCLADAREEGRDDFIVRSSRAR